MLTKEVEFYAISETEVEAVHNKQFWKFTELPQFAYDVVKAKMKKADATIEEMQQFVLEIWGGLDRNPDIDEFGNAGEPEYVPGVTAACFDNGNLVSRAQLRVLQVIHLENKAIAEKLCMSPFTVARHVQDLFSQSGINNRTTLALWAKNKGII
jgi:DNA-binding CsgD family transcriptional regulator